MKQTIGTVVLFVLLILTVVALTQFEPKDTSAQKLDNSAIKYELYSQSAKQ